MDNQKTTKVKQLNVSKLIEVLQKIENKELEVYIFYVTLGEPLDIIELQIEGGEVYLIAE